MKKPLLILFITFFTLSVFSQPKKGSFIISFNGNYSKTGDANDLLSNGFYSTNKTLNLNGDFGYFITDRFTIGVGMQYAQNKAETTGQLKIDQYWQIEKSNVKNNLYLPFLYTAYYIPIIDKLYFNLRFNVAYGKQKTNKINVIASMTPYFQPFDDAFNDVSSGEITTNTTILDFSIMPEINYFVSSHIALSASIGNIEYVLPECKTKNALWNVNFNPIYWNIGIKTCF